LYNHNQIVRAEHTSKLGIYHSFNVVSITSFKTLCYDTFKCEVSTYRDDNLFSLLSFILTAVWNKHLKDTLYEDHFLTMTTINDCVEKGDLENLNYQI